MRPTWRLLPLAGVMAMAGLLGAEPRAARAQIPVYSNERVFAPTGPVMTGPAYVAAPGPVFTTPGSYIVPAHPVYRAERRYVTLRPNTYVVRSPLSFAPYSDAYPKTAPPLPTYYPTYFPVYPH